MKNNLNKGFSDKQLILLKSIDEYLINSDKANLIICCGLVLKDILEFSKDLDIKLDELILIRDDIMLELLTSVYDYQHSFLMQSKFNQCSLFASKIIDTKEILDNLVTRCDDTNNIDSVYHLFCLLYSLISKYEYNLELIDKETGAYLDTVMITEEMTEVIKKLKL